MDEGRALAVRVGLICLLVIPCWVIHREMAYSAWTGWYLNLFFFFFGPIAAGFYAGASGKNCVFTVYADVTASVVLTLTYAIIWFGGMFYFELLSLSGQLFALVLGLLLSGSALEGLVHRVARSTG